MKQDIDEKALPGQEEKTLQDQTDRSRRAWLARWLERHQHPASQILHALAIPMLPWAGALAIVQLLGGAWSLWWRPAGLIVISYVLQWIGHHVEGNDMGEWILIKKALGRDYVAVAPRYRPTPSSEPSPPRRLLEMNRIRHHRRL